MSFSRPVLFSSTYALFHQVIPLLASLGLVLSPSLAHAEEQTTSLKSRLVVKAHERYQQQKIGLFVHYVPTLTVDPQTNQPVQDIDELAKKFDAVQFAQDAADFGVEYVIFTAHHFSARMLYPSAVSKRWRDDRRKAGSSQERNWKTYSDLDVIDRLATELAKKKIDLHLLRPPNGRDLHMRKEGRAVQSALLRPPNGRDLHIGPPADGAHALECNPMTQKFLC